MGRFELGTNILKSADAQLRIKTKEGPVAYVEAIEFLKAQKSLKPLKWNENLQMAAKDHSLDLSANG